MLEEVLRKMAERKAHDEGAARMSALNRKATIQNRQRAYQQGVTAAKPGKKAGQHDPYARKATQVKQYWATRKQDDADETVLARQVSDAPASLVRFATAPCCSRPGMCAAVKGA